MRVFFPGGKRISAEYKDHIIQTDQSIKSGGENLHPSPFDLFKASLGTCMGAYVMEFCLERQIPLDCISINYEFIGESVIEEVKSTIVVDERFPAKYFKAVVKATESCKVKKQLLKPPKFTTTVINSNA